MVAGYQLGNKIAEYENVEKTFFFIPEEIRIDSYIQNQTIASGVKIRVLM